MVGQNGDAHRISRLHHVDTGSTMRWTGIRCDSASAQVAVVFRHRRCLQVEEYEVLMAKGFEGCLGLAYS